MTSVLVYSPRETTKTILNILERAGESPSLVISVIVGCTLRLFSCTSLEALLIT